MKLMSFSASDIFLETMEQVRYTLPSWVEEEECTRMDSMDGARDEETLDFKNDLSFDSLNDVPLIDVDYFEEDEASQYHSSHPYGEKMNVYKYIPASVGTTPMDQFARKMANLHISEDNTFADSKYFDEDFDPVMTALQRCNNDLGTDSDESDMDEITSMEIQHKSLEEGTKSKLYENWNLVIETITHGGSLSLQTKHATMQLKNLMAQLADLRQNAQISKMVNIQQCVVQKENIIKFEALLNSINYCYDYERKIHELIANGEYVKSISVGKEFMKYFSCEGKHVIENIPILKDFCSRAKNLELILMDQLCTAVILNVQNVERYKQILDAYNRLPSNDAKMAKSIQSAISLQLVRLLSNVDGSLDVQITASILQCLETYKSYIEATSSNTLLELLKEYFPEFWGHCLMILESQPFRVDLLLEVRHSLVDVGMDFKMINLFRSNFDRFAKGIESEFVTFLREEDYLDVSLVKPLEFIISNGQTYRKYAGIVNDDICRHLSRVTDMYMIRVLNFCAGNIENENVLIGYDDTEAKVDRKGDKHFLGIRLSKEQSRQERLAELCDTKNITSICVSVKGLDEANVIQCVEYARQNQDCSPEAAHSLAKLKPHEILLARWHAADSLAVLADFLSSFQISVLQSRITTLRYLQRQCDKISCLRTIGPLNILSNIFNVDWCSDVMPSRANMYVDEIAGRILEALGDVKNMNAVKDKLYTLTSIVYLTCLEGFAFIDKCSIQGRSSMSLDLGHLREQLAVHNLVSLF